MTLQKPGSNTLIDQIFLGQVVDEINTIGDKFSNAAATIYNTSTKKSITTYFGGFIFATTQLEVTQTLSKTETSRYTKDVTFGKDKKTDFLVPPLVFATIETDSITGTGSTASTLLNGVVVSNVTADKATIAVVLGSDSDKPTIKYRVNVLAIGLAKL
jgi:hypothetical protein